MWNDSVTVRRKQRWKTSRCWELFVKKNEILISFHLNSSYSRHFQNEPEIPLRLLPTFAASSFQLRTEKNKLDFWLMMFFMILDIWHFTFIRSQSSVYLIFRSCREVMKCDFHFNCVFSHVWQISFVTSRQFHLTLISCRGMLSEESEWAKVLPLILCGVITVGDSREIRQFVMSWQFPLDTIKQDFPKTKHFSKRQMLSAAYFTYFFKNLPFQLLKNFC